MRTYKGNEKVEPGIYFNLRELAFRSLEDEGRLPGGADDVWRAVPFVAMLVVGPVLGLLYAMFLPLIGFLMLAGVVFSWVGRQARLALGAGMRVLTPAWQPALAFLGRGRAKPAPAEAPAKAADPWAAEVREELDRPVAGEEPKS